MSDDRERAAGEWVIHPIGRKLGAEMLSAVDRKVWLAAQELAAGAIRNWTDGTLGMPASYGGAADGVLTSEQTHYLIEHEGFRAHVMHRATDGPHDDFTNLAYATRLAVTEPAQRNQVREHLINYVWELHGQSDLDQSYFEGYYEHALEDRQMTGERAFFTSEADMLLEFIDFDREPSEPERFGGITDAEWQLMKSMPAYSRTPPLCTDLAIVYAAAQYETDYEFEDGHAENVLNADGWRVDRPGVDPNPIDPEAVAASNLALMGYAATLAPGGAMKLSRDTQYGIEPERGSDIGASR